MVAPFIGVGSREREKRRVNKVNKVFSAFVAVQGGGSALPGSEAEFSPAGHFLPSLLR